MGKYTKLVAFLCVLVGGLLIAPLIMIAPPIGLVFFFIAPIALFALPFAWVASLTLWIILEKNKTRVIPVALFCTIALFFKLGILWLSWALALILNTITILFLIKWWEKYKNITLKLLLSVLLVLLAVNVFTTLNPFASSFGFFGAGELITLNTQTGNPCNNCQNDKWDCEQPIDTKNVCNDLENIKNCYCCKCIKNFKFCTDCFFFWDNNHQCDPLTNKCQIGW